MNITQLSSIHIQTCDVYQKDLKPQPTFIQLIQKPEIRLTIVHQCRIKITRHIHYCGMHSHLSAVTNGYASFTIEVGKQTCRSIMTTKTYYINQNNAVTSVKINSTSIPPKTFAGKISTDGTCQDESYSDYYGSWDNVIVSSYIEITLKEFSAPISISENKLIPSGFKCDYLKKFCNDVDTYWDLSFFNECSPYSVDVIYQGDVFKIQEYTNNQNLAHQNTFFVEKDKTLFALRVIKNFTLCGLVVYQTEHPKLIIIESITQDFYYKQSQIIVENLDMFTYINTKFVHLEKHLKSQLIAMYKDLSEQKCDLETQVIQNLLTLAVLNPNDFAYVYMNGPGYMAHVLGKIIHLIKCIPVDVSLVQPARCYNKLPVKYQNSTWFMNLEIIC